MSVLVIDSQLPFTELAARLSADGWQRAADPTAPPPIIPGEPELADFERGDLHLHYRFEPATGTRELRIPGPRGDRELAALEVRLRGQGLAEQLLHSLAQWKEAHPDRSAVFQLTGTSSNKLQILRWFARDRRESNEHIDSVLRTAFEDSDWEVRLTALLVAARLRAANLLNEALKLRLPDDTADGVNVDERRMLRTVQLCAIELLRGSAVPPLSELPPDTKATMHDHLLRCLAGKPVRHHEKAFLYVTSLATPLPDEVSAPTQLPVGVVRTSSGYALEAQGLELCWIPPIDHWLGEDLPRMQIENPIRNQRSRGFFIARTLQAACDYKVALEHCRQLSDTTKLDVRLPTADEWEMAARGPDARRFPWGNNARSDAQYGMSPWGLTDAVGCVAQWTSSTSDSHVLVCGGKKQWVCAMREPVDCNSICALRLVVEL